MRRPKSEQLPRLLTAAQKSSDRSPGTTDVDLVIGIAVEDESPEASRTLEPNLMKASFPAESSFRCNKQVKDATVTVEFLCETDQVAPAGQVGGLLWEADDDGPDGGEDGAAGVPARA